MQENNSLETKPVSSRIDSQIVITRKALNLENITEPYLKRENMSYGYASEFGFSSPRIPMVRRFIWLNIKLAALYLAKYFNWIFRQRA